MLGNMLNDLAEAIRRWTEKKISSVRRLVPMINYNSGLREIMMRSRAEETYRVFKKFMLNTKTC